MKPKNKIAGGSEMTVYGLKIKIGYPEPSGVSAIISSATQKPAAEKVEHFSSQEARMKRRKEIDDAVTVINLVPYLVSLDVFEFEVK